MAANERIYAIGDVHGCLDLVIALLGQLKADASDRPQCSGRIVFLGDLIDRGPDTKGVVQLVRRLQQNNGTRVIVLCGNHEDLLLASAQGIGSAQRLWLENGGDATLRSYDLDPQVFGELSTDERARQLRRTIGPETLDWLETLPTSFRSGDYFFCHAGVRSGTSLTSQRREDLLWIRNDFVDHTGPHGAVIVHGHSQTSCPEDRGNRINVDTGAYRTGVLTAVGLEDTTRRFIAARQAADQPITNGTESQVPGG